MKINPYEKVNIPLGLLDAFILGGAALLLILIIVCAV